VALSTEEGCLELSMTAYVLSRRQLLRGSLAIAGAVVLSGCGIVPAPVQQPARVPRVGVLLFYSDTSALEPQAFLQGMRELGYVDGENVAFEYRFAREQADRLPALAAELVDARVELIWTFGTPGSVAARNATSTIPVVFVGGGNPVELGLVQSLAHPGGNLTGVTLFSTVLNRKRLEVLKDVAPRTSRVAFILDATSLLRATVLDETRAAGQTLGIEIYPFEVRDANDCAAAFQAAEAAGVDGLLVQPSPLLAGLRSVIVDLALKGRLPGVFPLREFAEVGGLVSYGPDGTDAHRRSAAHVDRILKGARPQDLPVEQATAFDFIVNQRTAQALGLTIPSSVMQQATEVIR
jgi:putative ABC transport system substrate-binding protein